MKRLLVLARVVLASILCAGLAPVHADTTYARPYTGGGPNNYPSFLGNTIGGVYLVDPVSGNPVTPTGTITGGSGSNPAGVVLNNSVGTTSATILTAGQVAHWMVIQNTSANILYISFTSPASAANGYAIAANSSLVIPTGTSNPIFAVGSAASTTYAILAF